MTTQPSLLRSTRSQSPSAKFYSRNFATSGSAENKCQEPATENMTLSAPQSKRRKINPGSDTDIATEERLEKYRTVNAKAPQSLSSRQRDAGKSKRAADDASSGIKVPRATSGNTYTKRASALNLHNYPSDHHPVGVAIWVIQKIDSARRERAESISSRDSSPEAFSGPSSSGGLFQASGQASEVDETENPGDRRQAQRERKIKQRLENWAKNKENDVVARAKLDAKKKFGSNPSTHPILLGNGQPPKPSPSDEKEAYIRKRIRDDFTRLMNKQTKIFAEQISKLEPFKVGFSKKCFPVAAVSSESDAGLVTAGTLLVDVLPALAEKGVSRTSQLAAEALVQALETGSVSPESFFDALATLAENKDILTGSDKILTQLFSRSSCSGNTKALRTSSGADSKLFATTNGSFIIYNTIENTEVTPPFTSRYPSRSFAITNSTPTRVSSRQRRPASGVLGISELSRSPQTRASMSPRISPPKVLKLARPSKLRGSVSFAQSRSPRRERASSVEQLVSAVPDPKNTVLTSKHEQASQRCSFNEYRSEQVAPPSSASNENSCPPIQINDDLIKNLLDLAFLASHEDTDDDSQVDVPEANLSHPPAEIGSVRSPVRSPEKHSDDQSPSNLHSLSKPEAHGNVAISTLASVTPDSAERVASLHRVIAQVPTSKTNFSYEQARKSAALYDQLAQGEAFETAKVLGFSYPEIPRPFTDRDGWTFTGVTNEFGEEMVEIDRQSWTYPPQRSDDTQQPLRRLKSKAQSEQESIFGFPPVSGSGNGPRHKRQRLQGEGEENVGFEKLMFDARKAAQARGLPFDRSLNWEQLASSIKTFDDSRDLNLQEAIAAPAIAAPAIAAPAIAAPAIAAPAIEADSRELDDTISSQVDASETSAIDSDDDSDYEPDRTARYDVQGVWRSSNGAQASTFNAANGGRASPRKLRERPSSSSAQANPNPMDISAILDTSHEDLAPRNSTTRYNIRPPSTSGTFNTFIGPITSSDMPAASPTGTPTSMRVNFGHRQKQASTSPAPNGDTRSSRRPSTASLYSSSLISRPSSTQPVDIDQTNAFNAGKGYNTSTTNSSAHTTVDPASPTSGGGVSGLNGGFPGGGIIINAPDKRGDGRGQRRKSKAPDFKMTVQKAGKEGPKVQARAVRGGTVLKFT